MQKTYYILEAAKSAENSLHPLSGVPFAHGAIIIRRGKIIFTDQLPSIAQCVR